MIDKLKLIIFGSKKRYRYRDAETGHFCSAAYAKANPKTTVRERADG